MSVDGLLSGVLVSLHEGMMLEKNQKKSEVEEQQHLWIKISIVVNSIGKKIVFSAHLRF